MAQPHSVPDACRCRRMESQGRCSGVLDPRRLRGAGADGALGAYFMSYSGGVNLTSQDGIDVVA